MKEFKSDRQLHRHSTTPLVQDPPCFSTLDAGFCNSQSVGVTRVIDGSVLLMPIYEFACPKCRRIFNFLSKRLNPDHLPACPKCGGRKMVKQMSRFATTKGRRRTLTILAFSEP